MNWLNSQYLFSHQDQVVNIFDKKYDFFILLRRPLGERSPVLLIFNAFKALNVNFSKIKQWKGMSIVQWNLLIDPPTKFKKFRLASFNKNIVRRTCWLFQCCTDLKILNFFGSDRIRSGRLFHWVWSCWIRLGPIFHWVWSGLILNERILLDPIGSDIRPNQIQ